ncbi:MAG: hypothetical protein AB1Z50_09305, partial [Desulfuromonadales bacterium]
MTSRKIVKLANEKAAAKDPPGPDNLSTDPVTTKEEPAPPDLDNPSYYLNRELTWLEFNKRVLHEAEDPRTPLLERLK